jgi:hypothetical protein
MVHILEKNYKDSNDSVAHLITDYRLLITPHRLY